MRNICFVACLILVSSMSFAQVIEDFSLESIDNELVSLSDIKGDQLTIIDFWATWCKPCTKAMPKLNELYNEYVDSGVQMIGISCDGPRSISKVKPLISSMNIDYTILTDIDCEVMNDNQYQSFPTLIILNSDNEVIYTHEGYRPGDEKEIEKAIKAGL